MTQISRERKAVLDRLEIVVAYLSRNMAVTSFVRLFNAGGIYRPLFEETGPVDAEDLDRWVDICRGVIGEEEVLSDEAVSAAV
jgi:hypothetical protein